MRPVSAKRRRRDATYPQARLAVWERSDGMCEALCADHCTGRCEQVHHIAGRGGPDVCEPCHRYIERHREWAYENGLLRSRLGGAA